MEITIREVSTLRQLKQFIRCPHTLYRRNPYWVPNLFSDDLNTLRKDRNPAFAHCEARYWMAYRNGKAVGRIAAILNKAHIEKWGQHYMRFGWFDFIDDPAVSSALLQQVETWAVENGLSAVHGPLGFTDLDREGMLVEGFEELGTLATMYNHSYYPVHMEQAGYSKDTDWVEYEIRLPEKLDDTIARVARAAQERSKVHLLEARSKKEMLKYAGQLFEVLDEAYQDLYGVVPLTAPQRAAYTEQYFGFIKPEFVPVVLDENDRLVAFGITMPSFSSALQKSGGKLFPFGFLHLLWAMNRNNKADLYLIAVRRDYQGRGINAIMMNRMLEVFRTRGIYSVESNPELETNSHVQAQWKFFDKRQHKRRRCYIRHLDQS